MSPTGRDTPRSFLTTTSLGTLSYIPQTFFFTLPAHPLLGSLSTMISVPLLVCFLVAVHSWYRVTEPAPYQIHFVALSGPLSFQTMNSTL